MNLYISNLGEQITDESLRAVFATHGKVNSSRIVRDGSDLYTSGVGFVEMPNDAEASIAISRINGQIVNGRSILVEEAGKNPIE